MSDLTIVIIQQCRNENSIFKFGGYTQTGIGTEQPTCTCKGYKYKRMCKHIREAQDRLCQYHEQIHGKPRVDGICPFCGGSTEYVKVGV